MARADDEPSSSIPTRTIHEAYRDALQARAQYQQAAGGQFEQPAHERLQDAVANYYEVLRPLLSSMNATEDLWEETELWPTEPIYHQVAICPGCGVYAPIDGLDEVDLDLAVNELCPSCGNAVVEKDQIPKTDETGQIQYRYVEGLESVDDIWSQQVEREVQYSSALGTQTEPVTETRLVPPEHLKIIARKLDEALKQLKLHAKADDRLPKGSVTSDFDPA